MPTIKQRIIDYLETRNNEPASYLDLMINVTYTSTLASTVEKMLEVGELTEVVTDDEVLVKLKAD